MLGAIWGLLFVGFVTAVYLLASILGALGRIEQQLRWLLDLREQSEPPQTPEHPND